MAPRASGLVSGGTIPTGSSGRPVTTERIQGLIYRHIRFEKHWFEAFKESSTYEITTVENYAHVGPFGVHRTRCVNWSNHLDLATTGIVPNDLDKVVEIYCHIGVTFVANNWSK